MNLKPRYNVVMVTGPKQSGRAHSFESTERVGKLFRVNDSLHFESSNNSFRLTRRKIIRIDNNKIFIIINEHILYRSTNARTESEFVFDIERIIFNVNLHINKINNKSSLKIS